MYNMSKRPYVMVFLSVWLCWSVKLHVACGIIDKARLSLLFHSFMFHVPLGLKKVSEWGVISL